MASSAVEIILNRDSRLRLKNTNGWTYLSNRTLGIARDKGLPSDVLLSPGEKFNSQKPIAFVNLRNKVMHGNITYLVTNLSDYDPEAERLATEQDEKMRKFVSEWFNTAPDVQDGHIHNNQWPI